MGRLSVSSLHPWVAVEPNGIVLCAHCTCMAGLGEACSHVATLLFTMEINTRLLNNTSCTSLACSWLPAMQKVDYSPIAKIDFSSPKSKMNNIYREKSIPMTAFKLWCLAFSTHG